MAACGSLQHLFEKPLPENPTLFDSLSPWKHIKSMKSPLDHHDSSSFTEIFGELHFKENNHPEPEPAASSSSYPLPILSPTSTLSSVLTELSPQAAGTDRKLDERNNNDNKSPTTMNYIPTTQTRHYRHSDSFSSMNSESLSLCTEGLGFESFDNVEDLKNDNIDSTSTDQWQHNHHERRTSISTTKHMHPEYLSGEPKRSRISGLEFPPPISCIGMSGKPWVCFKSYRNNGRFILKEVRIPTQEFLHACREDGRLKLQFIQSDDEIIEEDEDDEEEEEDEEERENEEKGNDDELDQNDEEEEKENYGGKDEIRGDE